MFRLSLVLVLCAGWMSSLTGCVAGNKNPDTGDSDSEGSGEDDLDGDGYGRADDCDDADAEINPGVEEECDDLDNNCNGEIDEGLAESYYTDDDGDGFGDPGSGIEQCYRPDGYVPNADDCDDADDAVYPGQTEICDGIDNDCNGEIDDGATSGDLQTWYADSDGDTYGDPDDKIRACGTPEGYSLDDTDCDDADGTIHPGADEICDGVDQDCDEVIDDDPIDPGAWYADADDDGFGDPATETLSCEQPEGTVTDNTDCDDGHDDTWPGADEICDTRDNDCDGDVDEDPVDGSVWYTDADGDDFGDDDSVISCEAPAGTTGEPGDCDDGDDAINPDADEVCDGVDNDCDGTVDVGASDADTWYADSDSDGYGDDGSVVTSCSMPSGYVADKTDCDDTDSGVHPGASEYCDDEDDDCDGKTDESAVDKTTWYADTDDDGYGDSGSKKTACDAPSGYVDDKTDCDDDTETTHPGADELCNDVDDDCDGVVDDSAIDGSTWYKDTDGDAYGDASKTKTACDKPSGYVSDDEDCDDADADIHPDADEVCNGDDDDCDGSVDEDPTDASTYYADTDGDTYGDPGSSKAACSKPSGYVTNSRDCDDDDSDIHPGADEYCNDLDDDCDSSIDESAVDKTTWYKDADSDAYGDSSKTKKDCDAPSGYVADKTDCNDAETTIHPGADELCNLVDDDCDGSIDESAIDMPTWYRDRDGDDYGDSSSTKSACTEPSGYGPYDGDCDDSDSSVHPYADEVCEDGADQDCDGLDAPCGPHGDEYLSLSDARLVGESKYDYAASSIECAGDVNADGYDDIIVGAYGQDPGGTYSGAAYIVEGPVTGTVDLSAADAKLSGESANDKSGYSVDGTGDVDGDGYDDVIVGASEEDTVGTAAGAAYLVLGPISSVSLSSADAKITANSANDTLGTSLTGAGDVDGDGDADSAFSAYQDDSGGTSAGTVYLFYGTYSGSKTVASADARLVGETKYDFAGWSVDGGGDLDGDGLDDVLVGATGEDTTASSAGAAYVVLGALSGTIDLSAADAKLRGIAANDYAGSSVANAGDINMDGYSDLLVGAYGVDVGTSAEVGAAYLVYGPVSSMVLSSADVTLSGETAGDRAGYSVSSAGDVDKDGYDDLLVGSYRYDLGTSSDIGAAYLMLGPLSSGASLGSADATFIGEKAGDYVGWDVSSGGDNDADGFSDLLFGAWKQDDGGADAGMGYLMLGGAAP